MLTDLAIENFRGIARGELSGLSNLNVLVGPNNSGKSTCLEAAIIAAGARVPDWNAVQKAISFAVNHRGNRGETSTTALFCDGSRKTLGIGKGLFEYRAGGHFQASGVPLYIEAESLPPVFVETSCALYLDVDRGREANALENAISQIEESGTRSTILDLLRPLLPTLNDLRIHVRQGVVLYVEERDGRQWPAFAAGDGFLRLLMMAGRLAASRGKVVAIEEPELFEHPGALPQIAKVLWNASQHAQIILATHSLELIDALIATANDRLAELALFRLRLEQQVLRAVKLEGPQARSRREDLQEDFRR